MTNTALLERIAEIEGAEKFKHYYALKGEMWNPLESDADAFALIEKYGLTIERCTGFDGDWFWTADNRHDGNTYEDFPQGVDPDLKSAIVLAVVAAHE